MQKRLNLFIEYLLNKQLSNVNLIVVNESPLYKELEEKILIQNTIFAEIPKIQNLLEETKSILAVIKSNFINHKQKFLNLHKLLQILNKIFPKN